MTTTTTMTTTMEGIAKNYAAAKDDAGRQAIADAVKAEHFRISNRVSKSERIRWGSKNKTRESIKSYFRKLDNDANSKQRYNINWR